MKLDESHALEVAIDLAKILCSNSDSGFQPCEKTASFVCEFIETVFNRLTSDD